MLAINRWIMYGCIRARVLDGLAAYLVGVRPNFNYRVQSPIRSQCDFLLSVVPGYFCLRLYQP
jgi:hypothetical protein